MITESGRGFRSSLPLEKDPARGVAITRLFQVLESLLSVCSASQLAAQLTSPVSCAFSF